MFSKLKKILAILFSLNLIIFANTNVEARNDYAEALREILEVAPKGDIEAKDEYEELEKPAVEFSKDMKFLNITLKDSIILALHNNYDIRIAKLEPMIEEKDITVAKSEFDPTLKITGDVEDSEVPSNSQLQVGLGAGLGDFRDDSNTLNATIEKPLETGATFTLEYNLERRFLDPPPFAIFNPSATASIETKITQPLLKGAGIFYNRSNIYIARNDKKKSILELRDKARTTIKDVQKKYWELVGAIEDLRVKNKSIERARKLLRENKIQVKVGTMAPIEVLVAEEDVASQYEKVIEAENKVKDKEDELKQVMNLSNNSIFSDVAIIPLDKASFEIKEVSLDESIKTALESRPDLFKEGIEIENKRIKVKQQKNQLLPKFDFEAGIRYQGLAGNKGNAIDSAFSQDFQSEFFGVTLEIPLGNREARSNYSKAKLEERKSIIETRKKEQEIVVEVRKAVRQIKTNAEKIRATKKGRGTGAKKNWRQRKKKFKVGRTASIEVVRSQEDLAEAEGKAVEAIVNYRISLGNLDAVVGTILEKNNIIIEDENLVIKQD